MDLGFIKNRTIKLRKIIEGFNNEFIFFLPKNTREMNTREINTRNYF